MNIAISPSCAKGTVAAPPSKSMAHRLLLAAGLSKGTSTIEGICPSQDILATIDCLSALGATVDITNHTARITGCNPAYSKGLQPLPCRESGSTLRFLIPLCLLSGASHTLTGYGRLLQRPQWVYEQICAEHGLLFHQTSNSIEVQGSLQGGDFTLPGNVSSQFITGLLFALPLSGKDSTIHLLPPVESRSYIHLTLKVLNQFGIAAAWQDETTLTVPAGEYQPQCVWVEGDYSNAAFLDALNVLGGNVQITGLQKDSLQGDAVYATAFQQLQTEKATISLADCPDLGPILMAMAAATKGATFTHTARLQIKESDRGAAMATELSKFGITVEVAENTITVHNGSLHPPTVPLQGHNDHRIVMALATLCSKTGGVIEGAQAVAKSYPDYWQTIKNLGILWKEV